MEAQNKAADGTPLQVLEEFKVTAELDGNAGGVDLKVVVTNVHELNLHGTHVILELGLTDLTGHFMQHTEGPKNISVGKLTMELPVSLLQKACKKLCQEVSDLFKLELKWLNQFELKVNFKPQPRPIFHKPRPVPLANLEDPNDAYKEGIRKGVWKLTDYGTAVVPV